MALGACGPPDPPPPTPAHGASVALPDDPARAFDFWVGTWDVQNMQPGFGGGWGDVGRAVARIHSVAGGNAVLERWSGKAGGDLFGFSLRAWDPVLGKWVIWLNWHGGQPAGFFIMHGERRGERIELFPPGDTSSTRCTFSQAHEESCQWDSANSRDGESWVSDWVMRFSRTAPAERLDAANVGIELPPHAANDHPQTRELDELLGAWAGAARAARDDGAWQDVSVRVAVTSMLEGFGTLLFVDTSEGDSGLTAMSHDPASGGWRGVRAASGAPGLTAVGAEVRARGFTFSGPQVQDAWHQVSPDLYRWERSRRTPEGSWRLLLEAELERQAPS
jgi:hypothetical protein